MTYEEARNRLLNSEMPKDKAQREYDWVCFTAIEKQIPKKPVATEYYSANCCPCCGEYIITEYGFPKYCEDCGQAIDWSDEE